MIRQEQNRTVMSMLVPPQAHSNVRDVLAPLFCNGRSFASLIDELSRHFKFESSHGGSAAHDAKVFEASSESQSTDSEAEGNISDEADDQLIQARVSAQARSHPQVSTPSPSVPTSNSSDSEGEIDNSANRTPSMTKRTSVPAQYSPISSKGTTISSSTTATPTTMALSKTRSTPVEGASSQSDSKRSPFSSEPASKSSGRQSPSQTRTHPPEIVGVRSTRDSVGKGKIEGGTGDNMSNKGKASSSCGGGDTIRVNSKSSPHRAASSGTPERIAPGGSSSYGVGSSLGGSGSSANGGLGNGGGAKGIISGDELTVLAVTANADVWSEAVGAALAARARAGYVFAQEVDPDSPLSSEFWRETFTEERTGTRKALEVRMRLIPAKQKVLLCSAWVDSGEYLEAAARLVAQCQAEVFGIACVRFEQNPSTKYLVDRFNLFAKSMPKGSVPSLNMGMKSCIPASLTKGYNGYTYNLGGRCGGTWVINGRRSYVAPASVRESGEEKGSRDIEGRDEAAGRSVRSNNAGGSNGSSVAARSGVETRQGRARKRRRSRTGGHDRELGGENADTSPPHDPPPSPPPEVVLPDLTDEGRGGLPAGPAADEASAGEGLAAPGDGGAPAGRYESGEVTEGAGGRAQQQTLGVLFTGEEGDYAADSERSTDYEFMNLCGGGGNSGAYGIGGRAGRESEHELSEREMGCRGSGAGIGRRGRENGAASASAAGRRGRRRNATRSQRTPRNSRNLRSASRNSSPETGLDRDADGGNSSSRNSEGEHDTSRCVSVSTPKRRRVGGVGLVTVSTSASRHSRCEPTSGSGCDASGGEERQLCMRGGESGDADGDGDGDGALADAEQDSDVSRGRRSSSSKTKAEELEWKLKNEGQPIFMSRGQTEEHMSHSPRSGQQGVDRGGVGVGRGVGLGRSRLPAQDPEDDRDRASSCSSIESSCTVHTTGSIIRLGARGSRKGNSDVVLGVAGRKKFEPALMAPNTPGGPTPWHHTSVYEANDPTEDRHVEITDEALGVRVYCVCDGHGGSRAAQFVCDNLARDVLSRVISMAEARQQPGGRGSVGGRAGRKCGRGRGDGRNSDDGAECDELWTGDEEEIRRLLAKAFAQCDKCFIGQLNPKKNRGYINAGCCVVMALLIRSRLYVAHVGDCRAVLATTDPSRFPTMSPLTLSTPCNGVTTCEMAATAGNEISGASSYEDTAATEALTCRNIASLPPTSLRSVRQQLRTSAQGVGELVAVALSRDHNCEDVDEAAMVRARSGDENAIRVSRNDEWKGARAIKRVAGSLAVTRAIGDAYLKEAVFSFSPYKESVPYITAEPTVTSVELTSADRFLVLATDGVWEQVSNKEAVQCISSALGSCSDVEVVGGGGHGDGATRKTSPTVTRRQQRSTATGSLGGGATSDALVSYVLSRSAQGHGMSLPALRALPRGPSRRMLHDDVCATVVHLTPARHQSMP